MVKTQGNAYKIDAHFVIGIEQSTLSNTSPSCVRGKLWLSHRLPSDIPQFSRVLLRPVAYENTETSHFTQKIERALSI